MVEEQVKPVETKKSPDATASGQQLIDQLADNAIKFASSVSPIPAVQAGIATDMVRSGLKNLANSGLVAQGEVGEEGKIAKLVGDKLGLKDKEAKDKEKAGKDSSTGEQTPNDLTKEQWEALAAARVGDLPKWMQPGIINSRTEQQNDPEVTRLYDKFSAPPRTVPPPPLEEYRGDVFMPPPPEIPTEFQTPVWKDRVFTPPNPNMKSEDPVATASDGTEVEADDPNNPEKDKDKDKPVKTQPTHPPQPTQPVTGPSKQFQQNPQSKEPGHR